MRIVVALFAIILFGSGPVFANDLDLFLSRVKKLAPLENDLTPPVICVCKDGSVNNNRTGQLANSVEVFSGTIVSVVVRCRVHMFDGGSGALVSASTCETWDLLPK